MDSECTDTADSALGAEANGKVRIAFDERWDEAMSTVQFKGWDCVVEQGRYGNGRLALILNDARDGEQVAVATVNLPSIPAGPNEVFIKDYSENAGMLEVLAKAGIVRVTGQTIDSGFATIPVCEVLLAPPENSDDPAAKSPRQATRDDGRDR